MADPRVKKIIKKDVSDRMRKNVVGFIGKASDDIADYILDLAGNLYKENTELLKEVEELKKE